MYIQISKTILLLASFLFSIIYSITAQPSQSYYYAKVDSLNTQFSNAIDKTTNYTEVGRFAEEALVLSQKIGYTKGVAVSLTQIGITYLYRGHYNDALKQYLAALKLYDQHQLQSYKKDYANLLINTAIALLFTEDYDRGIEYGEKAAIVAQQSGDKTLLGRAHHTLGNMYIGKQMLDSALSHHKQALALFSQTQNLKLLAALYIDIGIGYAEAGNLQQSINYTLKAQEIYKQLDFKERFAITFTNAAEDFYSLKQFSKALLYLDSAQYYASKLGRAGDLKQIYPLKAKTYAALNKTDSSSFYYEAALQLKDSLYNNTYQKELAALQIKFDVYKKEIENKLLAKDKRIAELYRNLAIIGVIVLIILLGFILSRQRLRIQQRVKNQLEEEVRIRTIEILQQKETISHTNLRLKLALNGAKFNSHFVFNVLNAIQHLVLDKKPLEAQDHLAKLSRLMRYALEKSPLDRIPLTEELQMLERYIQLEQLRLDHHFTYSIEIKANEHTTIPALVLQPYVENAILHGLTPATGNKLHLRLEAAAANGLLMVTIADNGVGRRKEKHSKHNSMGSSIGSERLDMLTLLTNKKHTLFIEDLTSSDGNSAGTKVILQLPIESHYAI